MNTRITTICIGILVIVSLALSGCLTPNVPDVPEPIPTPTVTPTAMPTTTSVPTLIPTVTPTPEEPINKSNWTVCDSRHNASWLQKYGCYGGGSSSNSGSNSPPPNDNDPVPEMMTIVMLVYGVFFITMLYVRRGGE